MKVTWRAALSSLVLLGVAGCASITSVPAGPMPLGDRHSITLSREWSDISILLPQRNPKVRVLSIDGPMLNRLYLAQGLTPGESLIKAQNKDHPTPTFRPDMGGTDLVEFISDSVAAMGYERVATSKLRPAIFGKGEAFRFGISAKTESGLEINGDAEVATADGKLYAVIYLAPAEHYYEATLPDVEAILNSAS
jgi:hypothetical protein